MGANEPTQAIIQAPELTVDRMVDLWLVEKFSRSQSERTISLYCDLMRAFRVVLRRGGTDLDDPDPRKLALAAQMWANQPRRDGRPSSASTINTRLAAISSFFEFAARHDLLPTGNPVKRVGKAKTQEYASAEPLDADAVRERLAAIDRSDPTGKRDYALLLLALSTGRRRAELAALRFGDLTISGNSVTVLWRRCKGGKVMRDRLTPLASKALLEAVESGAGKPLSVLSPSSPVWYSPGSRNHGEAMSASNIRKIYLKRLGVTKVHTSRHTFAHMMEQAGAAVSDIQAQLGHESLGTTGRYLQKLKQGSNPYAPRLEALLVSPQ